MALNIIKYLLPKDKIFYTLFENASLNNERIAAKLIELVNEVDFSKRTLLVKEMKDIEHQNDDITHLIFTELSKSFITPFDREDIHSLALALDDICDHIYDAAKKITTYKVDPYDEGIRQLADVIYVAVLAVNKAVLELRNLKNTQKIVACIIKINSAENQADDIFDANIERLFDKEDDVKTVIKFREIYQTLENATDMCEDVGDVIESIVVKYA
jgi:uncharacterized protein